MTTPLPSPAQLSNPNFTRHMFTQTWTTAHGWHDAGIRPYGPLHIDPAAHVFHNAQEIFEGMKAYRRPDGHINLFRPYENAQRFNLSAQRIAMPEVDPDVFVRSIADLVKLDESHLPRAANEALYVRPTMIGTGARLGVFPSEQYVHFVILTHSPYHAQGLKLNSAYISPEHVRAAHGGTGEAKTGGNYAASIAMNKLAAELGYSHVVFLDSVQKRFIEEGAGMNVAFVYGKAARPRLVTPALNGAILRGITRKSILAFAPDIGYDVVETHMDVAEMLRDIERGEITEAFGLGTGAVIAPLGRLGYLGKDYVVGDGIGDGIGPVTQHIYQTLTDIQHGRVSDPYGWTYEIQVA